MQSDSKLKQEAAQVRKQLSFEIALVGLLREGEEIEIVGVLEELLREIGLRRGKGGLEIRDGFPLPMV